LDSNREKKLDEEKKNLTYQYIYIHSLHMYKYTTYTFCALVFFLDIGQKLCFFYLRKKGKAEVMIIRHVSNERKENVLLISEDLDSRGKSK